MNFTSINERSQTQKTTYYMIPMVRKSRIGRLIDTESRLVVAKVLGRDWGPGVIAKGTGLLLGIVIILKSTVVMDAHICWGS